MQVDCFRQIYIICMIPSDRLSKELIQDSGYAGGFVVSTATYFYQVHHLEASAWVNSNCRIITIPWFATKSLNMKSILLQESPTAFCIRNLFVSANALHRA